MSLVRKLKPDRNIAGPLIPLFMFVLFGLSSVILGLAGGIRTLAVLIGLYAFFSLYIFLRTGNTPHLLVCLYQVFLGSSAYFLSAFFGTSRDESPEYILAYLSGLLFFSVLLVYLIVTRKMKWRGREIFELAAESVEENENGYTDRPRPVGKVEYSPQQIRDFARFLARHLIALPFYTSKNITLVPVKMGDEFARLLGLSGDFRDASWVNFDENGEVSVHIAQKDYLDYRQPLAFDPLCASFGQVFIDFFELIQKNEGSRVIDRLDDLNIAYFS